jgi:hypothetical protein
MGYSPGPRVGSTVGDAYASQGQMTSPETSVSL